MNPERTSIPVDPALMLRDWQRDVSDTKFCETYHSLVSVVRENRNLVFVIDDSTYGNVCESLEALERIRAGEHREAVNSFLSFLREHVYPKASDELALMAVLGDSFNGTNLENKSHWLDLLADSLVLNGRSDFKTTVASSQMNGCIAILTRVLSGEILTGEGQIPFHLPVCGGRPDLLDAFDLIDPDIFAKLGHDGAVKIAYEDSGHQPTSLQKRVIERAAVSSRVVVRAGTTYFNPNFGAATSSLSLRDCHSEIHFQVADPPLLVRGIYKTNASNGTEAAAALKIVSRCLQVEITRANLP